MIRPDRYIRRIQDAPALRVVGNFESEIRDVMTECVASGSSEIQPGLKAVIGLVERRQSVT